MSRSIQSKENYLSGGKIRRKTCREEEIWGKDVAHPPVVYLVFRTKEILESFLFQVPMNIIAKNANVTI